MFRYLAITTLLLACATPVPTDDTDYQAWLDEMFAADGPGATALLMRDGELLFRGAAGSANLELGVAMQPGHVMRIGSITKQFTAAAILLLQDRGRLNVNDDIRDYLPDFPAGGKRITIAQLLSHTSGIFNYTDIPGYWRGDLIRTDVTPPDLIALFANEPLQFEPGERFEYSNSGYALLGAIIERVSGKSYAEFLRDEIFAPLGMDDTHYGGAQLVPGRVAGYASDGRGGLHNALQISMTHPYAAGGLLSSVDDLARWNAALFGGDLLSASSLGAMSTAFELANGSVAEYGFGVYARERDGLRVIGHSGGIHGFSTSAWWLPDQRVYAVVLSNLEDSSKANELVWRLARDAASR